MIMGQLYFNEDNNRLEYASFYCGKRKQFLCDYRYIYSITVAIDSDDLVNDEDKRGFYLEEHQAKEFGCGHKAGEFVTIVSTDYYWEKTDEAMNKVD